MFQIPLQQQNILEKLELKSMISLCPSAQICLHLSFKDNTFSNHLEAFFQFEKVIHLRCELGAKPPQHLDHGTVPDRNQKKFVHDLLFFEKILRDLEKESLIIIEDLSFEWENWEWLTWILERSLAVRYIFTVSMLPLPAENWESLGMIPYHKEVFYGYRRQ